MFWENAEDAKAYLEERSAAYDEITDIEHSSLQTIISSGYLKTSTDESLLFLLDRPTSFVRPDNDGKIVVENDVFLKPGEKQFFILDGAYRAPMCNSEQNAVNRRAIRYFNAQEVRLQRLRQHVSTYNSATDDMTQYQALVDDYDANVISPIEYWTCEPTLSQLQAAYDSWWNTREATYAATRNAFAIIYGNANRELGELRGESTKVEAARREFETSTTGGGGTRAINDAHREFVKQQNIVAKFRLVSDGPYDAQKIFDELNRIVAAERRHSAISELDRLRNEYFEKAIPVPTPNEFTQSKSSAKFSFSQLNMGSYSWAVLKDTLLANIDGIAGSMEAAGYQVQLNSVYRNPRHPNSSGRSQHQYGTAVDIQVFDFNESGGPRDEEDWRLLRVITDAFSPVYTEPLNQSGPGHVHVDWRGLTLRNATFLQSSDVC